MAASTPTAIAANGYVSTDPELAAIDASVRWPVLLCFLTAVHWMVVGTFLLVYASSLTHPQDSIPILGLFIDLANNCSFFTYGRVWPAAIDALVYGWAGTAGLGMAIWLLARMNRRPVGAGGVLITAAIFWNVGIAIGLSGIFLGFGTGAELLEFPACAVCLLWMAYAIFSFWAVISYLGRKPGCDQIGQLWLMVGFLAFPWLYGAGSILLDSPPPGSGVVQGLLGAWYVHGIYTLWLAPMGLGLLYYLIPKLAGAPIRHASKVSVAFWTWIFFAPWTAVHDLVGGPFPIETVTTGLFFSGLLFIPVAIIGINLVATALEGERKPGAHGAVVLPFLTLSAVFFVVAGISEQILSIRGVNEVLRFTMFRECNLYLWLYGFFSFAVFGAIYYIVPRLLDFGWRSVLLIRLHYYMSVYGILLVIALVGFGGVMQGFSLENTDPHITIIEATGVTVSFYIAATMCVSLVSLGSGVFALHLGWMLLDWLKIRVRANALSSELLLEPYEPTGPAAKETRA